MAVQSFDQGYPDEAVARVVEETIGRDGVATPAAFGLAGLAVSTWVVASWLVDW
jgi:succinate-acetate transporter protein